MLNGTDYHFKTPKPDNVRIATKLDEPALFDLLWNGLHDSNDMGYGRSHRKVWEHINATCRGEKGIAGVIYEGPKMVASVGIVASQFWYSDVWFLSEVWMIVLPEYRSKGYADDLFNFAKWHREDMERLTGQEYDLECSVISNRRLEAKERLWATKGRKIGASFMIDRD